MQAFYFTTSVTLKLGDHARPFVAPINANQAPLEEIWVDTRHNCVQLKDFVQRLGEVDATNPMFAQGDWSLPVRLNGDLKQACLLSDDCPQFRALKNRVQAGRKLRVALFNAFGTGLGDNFVGVQMFSVVLMRLRSVQPDVEVDVIRTWQSKKPDFILEKMPWANQVGSTPLSLKAFLDYDAYYDFSDYSNLPGFLTRPWPDFQLINLGIDPQAIPEALKQARYEVAHPADFARGMDQVERRCGPPERLRVFVHASASNDLRSIPPSALQQLLSALQDKGFEVVTVDALVASAARQCGAVCHDCDSQSLDELCGLVRACDWVISTETFLLHVGCAVSENVLGLFVTTQGYPGGLMLPYQSNLSTINVDSQGRFSGHFRMSKAELLEQGLWDYFVERWEAAIASAICRLP